MASQGPVPLHHLLSRRLDAEDDGRYRHAAGRLGASGLLVHTPRACSPARSIERSAERSKARLLVIDDLHLWAGDDLNSSLVLLSGWAARASGTVVVTVPDHLVPVGGAELAAWTQVVDVAIRLVRPEQQLHADGAGEIDLDVLWHRLGPTARITAAFQGHYARIVTLARGTHQGDGVPSGHLTRSRVIGHAGFPESTDAEITRTDETTRAPAERG
jgi:replicative DNA helicase